MDAATGQLLGICTSNAKHSRSGGGGGTGSRLGSGRGGGAVTVLPHLNFSIPAAQLAPVVRAAQEAAAAEEAGGALGDAAGAALAAWRALDAEAAGSSELLHVWRLDPRQRERRRQQEQQQGPGGGGGFGGAVPPAKLQQLLRELRQPQAKL